MRAILKGKRDIKMNLEAAAYPVLHIGSLGLAKARYFGRFQSIPKGRVAPKYAEAKPCGSPGYGGMWRHLGRSACPFNRMADLGG